MESFSLGNDLGFGFVGYSGKQMGSWLYSLRNKSCFEAQSSLLSHEGLGPPTEALFSNIPNVIYMVVCKERKNGEASFEIALMDYWKFLKTGVGKDLEWHDLK